MKDIFFFARKEKWSNCAHVCIPLKRGGGDDGTRRRKTDRPLLALEWQCEIFSENRNVSVGGGQEKNGGGRGNKGKKETRQADSEEKGSEKFSS